MEESEWRIENVARESAGREGLIACHVLQDTKLYHRWVSEHDRLMRNVSAETKRPRQVDALRRAAFGLVHRMAMFDYLREQKITGRDRHAVFSLVSGEHDYVTAVLLEHGNYLRAASSLLCSRHVGLRLMQDRAFGDPLRYYEQLYADYFRAFCGTALAANQHDSGDTLRTLVPYLKRQLGKLRRAVLAMAAQPDPGLRGAQLDEPAANTQRLYRPFRAA
jgi:hypothetical protein